LTLMSAFVAGVILATLFGMFVIRLGDCPPEPSVCDAPGMFGFFLWIGLAPAFGVVSAMATHRWLSARDRHGEPRPTPEFLASAWPDRKER
jgi:hypothetical protein